MTIDEIKRSLKHYENNPLHFIIEDGNGKITLKKVKPQKLKLIKT